MTVIVSVKINDGIVMASDSASTFGIGQIYNHADKIVNLVKGLPIGVMVTGAGNIGTESITTLFKDLRSRLDGSNGHEWTLNHSTYTIEEVAQRVRQFVFEERVQHIDFDAIIQIRVCGYSAGAPLPELWDVFVVGQTCPMPGLVQGQDAAGTRWGGDTTALDRLLIGFDSSKFRDLFSTKPDFDAQTYRQQEMELIAHVGEPLHLDAMPIQDAIDLARYLVEVTVGFVRFAPSKQPKSVGGSIEIAAITKHEGFRWVQRRHFFPAAINQGLPH